MDIAGFQPISETTEYVKALIYGHMGGGKTAFTAGAPKPIWFDFENSAETLRHWPAFRGIPVKKPKTIAEMLKDTKEAIESPDVETIVVDTVTTCLENYLRDHMRSVASKRDQFILYESDYKYATQVFLDLFGILQAAPINVVFIGHERKVRNADSGEVTNVYPDITPRLQDGLTRLVNVVAYMESKPSNKGATRKLYLNPTHKIEAKNRLNIQETFIENPEWKNIFNV